MKQLVQSELQRLLMRRRTLIILVMSLLAFLFLAFFNSMFGVGFYDPIITTRLDSLNFSPFILRDYHFYFILIFCPFLTVETFNRERYSGEYRLVMIRPYSRMEFYSAKMISLCIIMAMMMFILWVIGNGLAYVMLPRVSETSFFEPSVVYSSFKAMIFGFKFYVIEFIILMSVIGIISLISLIVRNTVLSFLASVFVLWIIGFSLPTFEFLVSSTRSIFDVLLGMGMGWHVILYVMLTLVIGMGGSSIILKRSDYLS